MWWAQCKQHSPYQLYPLRLMLDALMSQAPMEKNINLFTYICRHHLKKKKRILSNSFTWTTLLFRFVSFWERVSCLLFKSSQYSMQGNNLQHTNQVRCAAQETTVNDSSKREGFLFCLYIFFKFNMQQQEHCPKSQGVINYHSSLYWIIEIAM